MTRPVIHALLNHRSPRVRQQARLLARRPRLLDNVGVGGASGAGGTALLRELDVALNGAGRMSRGLRSGVTKDGGSGGAGGNGGGSGGGVAVGADVYTPTADSGRGGRSRRRSVDTQ